MGVHYNLIASIASLMTSTLCMLIKSCDGRNAYVLMAMIYVDRFFLLILSKFGGHVNMRQHTEHRIRWSIIV